MTETTTAAYSLRRRLLVWLFAAISLGVLIQAAVSYRVALDEVGLISDYHMEQMALAIKSGLPPPAMPESLDTDDVSDGFDLTIQAWNHKGERVLGSSKSAQSMPTNVTLGFSNLTKDGRHFRVFFIKHQHGLIQVTHDIHARNLLAQRVAWRTSLPILLMAPLLLLGVWYLVSKSLKPVERSRAQVANRSFSDLSELPTQGLPQELLPFVIEINQLFDRIAQHLSSQRNFIADAAHELRSPLAALRLQIQSLQRTNNESDRQLASQRLLAGIDRSTRLVEQLLSLARQEAPDAAVQVPVDLEQIVKLAIADLLPLAQERGIDLGCEQISAMSGYGHPLAVRMLLQNLLENAIKYTPSPGMVNVSLLTEGSNAVLQIEDSGPGIPVHEHTRIFDRFYRLHTSDATGSGLGLAIVKAITDRQNIGIELGQSNALGGLMVRLIFPKEISKG